MKLRKFSEKFGTFGTFIPCHPKISASAKLFAVPKVPKVPLTTPQLYSRYSDVAAAVWSLCFAKTEVGVRGRSEECRGSRYVESCWTCWLALLKSFVHKLWPIKSEQRDNTLVFHSLNSSKNNSIFFQHPNISCHQVRAVLRRTSSTLRSYWPTLTLYKSDTALRISH